MARFLMAAMAAALLSVPLLSAACGGSDNDKKPPATGAATSAASATPTTELGKEGLAQPTVEDRVLPTPTPVPADGVVLTIVAGKTTLTPTRADLEGYPTTKLTAGGKEYSGITVQAFGDKASASPGSMVTIQGIRADGKRAGFMRGLLKDLGNNTLLVSDASGHLNAISSESEPDLWLTSVVSITFQQ
ncbi:MAG: hypothetical protein LC118_18770 [Dehalococcoidia bacterium]|nr:hypothetical protein [Dehalococcoidia bacterium]